MVRSSSVRSDSGLISISEMRSLNLAARALDWAFLRDRRSKTSCVDGILGLMYVLSLAVTAPGTISPLGSSSNVK